MTEQTTVGTPADLADERLLTEQSGGLAGAWRRVRQGNLGSWPVVIGLVLIWGVFTAMQPDFLKPENLVNLSKDIVPTGVLSLGIILVLLLGEIDLSIGSVSGLAASITVVLMVTLGVNFILALLAGIASGLVIGVIYGAVFTRWGVPSFVISLAGLLAFQGVMLQVLGATGTVNIPPDSFWYKFSTTGFVPPVIAYALVALAAVIWFAMRYANARRRTRAGLSTRGFSVSRAAIQAGLGLVAGEFIVWYLNQNTVTVSGPSRLERTADGKFVKVAEKTVEAHGIAYPFLLFLLLVVILGVVLSRTRWGRSVYAIGGNVEAARRAGIPVTRVYIQVFALCSMFAALGGVLASGWLGAVNQQSGGGTTNLNAIAAAVIGGTSLFGGRGSAYSALLGVLVIQSITSGLNLMSIGSPIRFIVTGAVLLLAVTIDAVSRRSRAQAGIA